MSSSKLLIASTLALFSLAGSALAQTSTTVGFDAGTSGEFTGNFLFESTGGNPGGNAHLPNAPVFFPSLRTGTPGQSTNPGFIGDYSSFSEVTFRFDVKVDSITDFIGNQIQRPLGISLIDHDIQGPNGASGVFFEFAPLSSAAQFNWTEFAVTINDTTSATLPAGWIGFGDEHPTTFAPILPTGATFATILAGVDEVQITGAVPGYFFNNAFYDMRIDNVTVEKGTGCIGISFCTPDPNSTGVAGTLMATGSDSVMANDLTLVAGSLPVGEFGIFLVANGTGVTNVINSGVLCLGGAFGRFNQAGQIRLSDAAGQFSLALDATQLPTPMGTVSAAPGDTFYFQAWHRDGFGFSNFTNGLQVEFQ